MPEIAEFERKAGPSLLAGSNSPLENYARSIVAFDKANPNFKNYTVDPMGWLKEAFDDRLPEIADFQSKAGVILAKGSKSPLETKARIIHAFDQVKRELVLGTSAYPTMDGWLNNPKAIELLIKR
jgi:hypothetical protein